LNFPPAFAKGKAYQGAWEAFSLDGSPNQSIPAFENKYQAVSQGARPFGERSILASM
jgi:hypothetical protein